MRWLLVALGMADPPCSHAWRQIQKTDVYPAGSKGEGLPIFRRYLLRCELCGDLKNHRTDR